MQYLQILLLLLRSTIVIVTISVPQGSSATETVPGYKDYMPRFVAIGSIYTSLYANDDIRKHSLQSLDFIRIFNAERDGVYVSWPIHGAFLAPIMATAYQFCAKREVYINFSPSAELSLIPGANADPRCRLDVDLLSSSIIGFCFPLFIMKKIG